MVHTDINRKFYFKSVIYGFQTTVAGGGGGGVRLAKMNPKVEVNLAVWFYGAMWVNSVLSDLFFFFPVLTWKHFASSLFPRARHAVSSVR